MPIESYDDSEERATKIALHEAQPFYDFGFENGWAEVPAPVTDCRTAKHAVTDIDRGPRSRGLDHVVTCQTCRIIYHYDSGD
jgi:hypothetical protein